MDPMRLALRQHLHPELELHPSWLPPDWPARHRRVHALTDSGRSAVRHLLRERLLDDAPPVFDTPLKRLALLDPASLRRLAAYTGLGVHKALLQTRATARQMRRQAARLDEDGPDFVVRRMPELPALRMNLAALQERPIAVGRVVVHRGYRLLLGTLAGAGEPLVQRVRLKLPRHAAGGTAPALSAPQREQLAELMLMCIVPERLKAWDWLF